MKRMDSRKSQAYRCVTQRHVRYDGDSPCPPLLMQRGSIGRLSPPPERCQGLWTSQIGLFFLNDTLVETF